MNAEREKRPNRAWWLWVLILLLVFGIGAAYLIYSTNNAETGAYISRLNDGCLLHNLRSGSAVSGQEVNEACRNWAEVMTDDRRDQIRVCHRLWPADDNLFMSCLADEGILPLSS